jgi:hypothetical protein
MRILHFLSCLNIALYDHPHCILLTIVVFSTVLLRLFVSLDFIVVFVVIVVFGSGFHLFACADDLDWCFLLLLFLRLSL